MSSLQQIVNIDRRLVWGFDMENIIPYITTHTTYKIMLSIFRSRFPKIIPASLNLKKKFKNYFILINSAHSPWFIEKYWNRININITIFTLGYVCTNKRKNKNHFAPLLYLRNRLHTNCILVGVYLGRIHRHLELYNIKVKTSLIKTTLPSSLHSWSVRRRGGWF